ncbi:thiamine phosphate synthase [Loigolactobacillus zhaoyuanensis]|uniref:Thiamine-phosphate synthase n=1 Tax=Loigolactobacillus zhaoyuanensis TaxID=2486017 RepID=A0ABW8UCD5_9LACO|nr:thiamine phosphate synthase [Loigolactobacillus zhaoyuanensis]
MEIAFTPDQLRAYFVCGSQDVPGKDLIAVVKAAIAAGITAFQFRDKGMKSNLTVEQRLDAAQQIRELCRRAMIPFIVDDDVDLALATAADGIHVGQSDEKIQQVIQQVRGQLFVGYSCSNLAEITAADQVAGIDYYGSGPVFATNSKADASPVIGLAGLKQLVTVATRPVVAIGGITEAQLTAIRQTGAAGSAVISMIAQSDDLQRTVTAMRQV